MTTTKEKLFEAQALIAEAISDIETLEKKLEGIELPPPSETPPPAPPETANRWMNALNELEYASPNGAWGRMNGGRTSSQTEVNWNMSRITPQYQADMSDRAARNNIPAAVLMAISCRESNHGNSLDSSGCGDNGNGFGCMQVDKRYHEVKGIPDPYSAEHLDQAAGIFMDFLSQVEYKHPDWPDKYLLKGGIVAYNSGVSNVQTIEGMDRGTTGNDYGADTAARAQMYLANGIV